MEKGLLDAISKIALAMWLYYSIVEVGESISSIKNRTAAEDVGKGFLRLT